MFLASCISKSSLYQAEIILRWGLEERLCRA